MTMPFAPCAGPGGISPAPGAENGFRQHSRSVPGAATAEMRNKRNRQAAAMGSHGRRFCTSQEEFHHIQPGSGAVQQEVQLTGVAGSHCEAAAFRQIGPPLPGNGQAIQDICHLTLDFL